MSRVKQGLKRQASEQNSAASQPSKQPRIDPPPTDKLNEDEEERLGSLVSFNAWKRKVERARGASACIKVDRIMRTQGGFNQDYQPLKLLDVQTGGQTLHLAFHGVLAAQVDEMFAIRPTEASAFLLSGFGATLAPSPFPGTEEAIVEYRERRLACKALWESKPWLEVIDGKLQGAEVRDLVVEATKPAAAAALPVTSSNGVAAAPANTPPKQVNAPSPSTKQLKTSKPPLKSNAAAVPQPKPIVSRIASAGTSKAAKKSRAATPARPAPPPPPRQVTPQRTPTGTWFSTPPANPRVQEVKPQVAAAAAAAAPAPAPAAAPARHPPRPAVKQLGKFDYTPLIMLRNGERCNVMGVVVSAKEPKHCGGGSGDAMFNVSLKDLWGGLLSVNIFKLEMRELPSPAPIGSILLLRSIINQSLTAVQYKPNQDWALLDVHTRMVRVSPTLKAPLSQEEEKAMHELLQRAEALSLAAEGPKGRPTVTLSKLEVRVYCDIVAEVLKVFVPTATSGHPPQLFVTDYTSHPLLPRANDIKLGIFTAEEVDAACANQTQGPGGGSVLGISLWDENKAAAELLNPGDLVRLGNVFPRMQPNDWMGAGMGNALKISSVNKEVSEPAKALLKRKAALFKTLIVKKAPWDLEEEEEDDFPMDEEAMRELDAIEAESAPHGAASSAADSPTAGASPAAPSCDARVYSKADVSAAALLPVECQGEVPHDQEVGEAQVHLGSKVKGKLPAQVNAEEEEDVKPIIKVTQEEPAKSSAPTATAARLSGTTANGTQVSRVPPTADIVPSYVSTPPATPPPSTPPPAQRVLTVRQAAHSVTGSGFSASPEHSASKPSSNKSNGECKSSGASSSSCEKSAPVICHINGSLTSISALKALNWRTLSDRPVRVRVRVKACMPADVDDWVIAQCRLCSAVLPKEHAFCVPCADEDAKDVHYRFFFGLLVEDASGVGSGPQHQLPLAMKDAREFLRDFTPEDVRRDPRALKRLRMRLEPLLGYAKAQNLSPEEHSEEEMGAPMPFDAGIIVHQSAEPDAKRNSYLTATVLRKFSAMRGHRN